jgi:putative component of toxin-antitoxin plasmid stabilization module
MITIVQTEVFHGWLDGLRDRKARLRIDDRLKRLANGNAGEIGRASCRERVS